jgi:hypothetical protein
MGDDAIEEVKRIAAAIAAEEAKEAAARKRLEEEAAKLRDEDKDKDT